MPTAWVRLLPFHSSVANEFLDFLISPSPYANCLFAKIAHFCNKTRDVTPFFSSKMLQNDDFMPIVSFYVKCYKRWIPYDVSPVMGCVLVGSVF